jgi:peptidyl-tRNA hydrolase
MRTMTASANGHEDPADEPAWALQLVTQVEKSAPPAHTAVCEAAAMAVLRLLTDPRTQVGGEWYDAVARWESGRIRKVMRRARGARWDALAALPGVTVDHDGALVRAFVPRPVTELPAEVGKLQVAGLDLTDEAAEPKPAPDPPYVLIWTNPKASMSTGKAAAQCGHAVQLLLWSHRDPSSTVPWPTEDPPVRVVRPTPAEWARAPATVAVHDAGFTEVAPGTITAKARLVGA